MSENVRMLREVYIARIRQRILDAQRAVDEALAAIVELEDELRKKPNAPEGWTKKAD